MMSSLEASPVSQAVREFMTACDNWCGTPTRLLDAADKKKGKGALWHSLPCEGSTPTVWMTAVQSGLNRIDRLAVIHDR
jgi:hypothetical protein